MKQPILHRTTALVLSLISTTSLLADDLQALSGRWIAEKTNDQGQPYTQALEIKKDKFTFKILRQQELSLYAEGDIKTQEWGPFKAARFFNIQGGRSVYDLLPVEDERTVIYRLGENEWTMATDFDKERSQPPGVTRYTKAAAEEAKTLVIDKIVMHKTPQTDVWYLCFEATVGDTTRRFNIPDKGYEEDELTIPIDLAIPNVRNDQNCRFVMKLDDVPGDECTEEMDNRSNGSFVVTDSSSQTFKPEEQWRYTIYWHLK